MEIIPHPLAQAMSHWNIYAIIYYKPATPVCEITNVLWKSVTRGWTTQNAVQMRKKRNRSYIFTPDLTQRSEIVQFVNLTFLQCRSAANPSPFVQH